MATEPPPSPESGHAGVPEDPSMPLAQLERAINRARQAQPAQGHEAALADDVSLLGRVYGRLIWRRAPTFRRVDLDEAEAAAWDRWSG